VLKYGGVVSSEHGDGIVRGWANPEILGEDLYDLCRTTKSIFDPDRRLNPGKIVDAPEMTDHLRMGPDYETRPFSAALDWSDEGGFDRAVEKCNGNGACRKLHAGTMCPSFMATREEEDSTRGRANALRMALSGGLEASEMTGERMHEVMDLCIQCKACKTECPSNVDMAKMKTEWLNHTWSENRMPLRTRLFAHQPDLARAVAGTPLASAANWMSRRSLLRKMGEAMLDIDADRALPPFARETFRQWFRRQHGPVTLDTPAAAGRSDDSARVVLFADTFNGCHTPAPLKAAVEFLHATGHVVEMPDADTCCGRTLLSKGCVSEAQERALETVEALYPYAEAGRPIVGLEPSCILTLADEFLDLLPGDPRAEAVAEAACTFETFVARQVERGVLDETLPPDWKRPGGDVLAHGHCHQKALVGTGGTEQALSWAGYDVETVEAGCCGMAGAFGYESEHVDISKQMAEDRLAPAVRGASPSTQIAATGFSCRSQIKDVTGRTARHPAELLADAVTASRAETLAPSSEP
jgi:Fe-S oxidoreductase